MTFQYTVPTFLAFFLKIQKLYNVFHFVSQASMYYSDGYQYMLTQASHWDGDF